MGTRTQIFRPLKGNDPWFFLPIISSITKGFIQNMLLKLLSGWWDGPAQLKHIHTHFWGLNAALYWNLAAVITHIYIYILVYMMIQQVQRFHEGYLQPMFNGDSHWKNQKNRAPIIVLIKHSSPAYDVYINSVDY